jgi:hypothetical protein
MTAGWLHQHLNRELGLVLIFKLLRAFPTTKASMVPHASRVSLMCSLNLILLVRLSLSQSFVLRSNFTCFPSSFKLYDHNRKMRLVDLSAGLMYDICSFDPKILHSLLCTGARI